MKTKNLTIALGIAIAIIVALAVTSLIKSPPDHVSPASSEDPGRDTMKSRKSNQDSPEELSGKRKPGEPLGLRTQMGENIRSGNLESSGATGNGSRSIEPDNTEPFLEGVLAALLAYGITEEKIPDDYRNDPEALLQDLNDLLDARQTDNDEGKAQPVFFSTLLPDMVSGFRSHTSAFDPLSTRIYAGFVSNTETFIDLDSIFVKWFNQHGDVLLYSDMDIAEGIPFNYVWFEDSDWVPGIYNVEIYQLESGGPVAIASGSYHVAELDDFVGHLSTYLGIDSEYRNDHFALEDRIVARFNFNNSSLRELFYSVQLVGSGEITTGGAIGLPLNNRGTAEIMVHEAGVIIPQGLYEINLTNMEGEFFGYNRFTIE